MTNPNGIPAMRGDVPYLVDLCQRLRKRPALLRKEFGLSGRTLAWESEIREAEDAISKALELLANTGELLLRTSKENERLRKDAARLDWIDRQSAGGLHVEVVGGEYRMKRVVTVFRWEPTWDVASDNVRDAIDAAIRSDDRARQPL